jgi:hypothetical protein
MALHIAVTDTDGKAIGTVSILGTTRIAEMDAMQRASKLAANHVGIPWAVAWQTFDTDGGNIYAPEGYGRVIARWQFVSAAAAVHWDIPQCEASDYEGHPTTAAGAFQKLLNP